MSLFCCCFTFTAFNESFYHCVKFVVVIWVNDFNVFYIKTMFFCGSFDFFNIS
ncbi:Uncharacterised protein [Mycobacteroides abscessus subsp. abscessus]|nr:Uncharacterised protein [Mycobacteroides abscessus subsp. abscessus]